jgi:hypothetical protein
MAASWTPTDDTDLGLIAIPGAHEPVMLEWRAYTRPGDPHGEPAYLGRFSYGAHRFAVQERFVYAITGRHGVARFRARAGATEHAGCTELVRVLAAGRELALMRFESGAYRGSWHSDVRHAKPSRHSPGVLETSACRVIFLFERTTVLLFRSLTLAGHQPA